MLRQGMTVEDKHSARYEITLIQGVWAWIKPEGSNRPKVIRVSNLNRRFREAKLT